MNGSSGEKKEKARKGKERLNTHAWGWGTFTMEPLMLPMKTMLPLALRSMRWRATELANIQVPSTLTAKSLRMRSRGYSVALKFSVKPAEVTRWSILPCSARTSAMQASTLVWSETSA